jgi:hypothetical protein
MNKVLQHLRFGIPLVYAGRTLTQQMPSGRERKLRAANEFTQLDSDQHAIRVNAAFCT